MQVQNRVTRTQPKLPEEVTRIGITVDKASPDLTMVVHLTSPDNRYDMLYLSNYAILNIKDELARWAAWVMCSCSAWATTRCVYGWTRTRPLRATSPPVMW